jgi:hypothetical protein
MAASRRDSSALTTTAEVISALGGLRRVSALTGAHYKLVSGWRQAPTFPARYFLVMTFALSRKRLSAPPELWKQVTPKERKKALSALIAEQKQMVAA